MLSRFHLIPARYGRTDRQTDRFAISISRVSMLTRDKKETGCCHALFTVTESVKHFVNNGSRVHCTFLDASKAFDKVLLNGL